MYILVSTQFYYCAFEIRKGFLPKSGVESFSGMAHREKSQGAVFLFAVCSNK